MRNACTFFHATFCKKALRSSISLTIWSNRLCKFCQEKQKYAFELWSVRLGGFLCVRGNVYPGYLCDGSESDNTFCSTHSIWNWEENWVMISGSEDEWNKKNESMDTWTYDSKHAEIKEKHKCKHKWECQMGMAKNIIKTAYHKETWFELETSYRFRALDVVFLHTDLAASPRYDNWSLQLFLQHPAMKWYQFHYDYGGYSYCNATNTLLNHQEQTFLFVRLVERQVLVSACPSQLLLPSSGPGNYSKPTVQVKHSYICNTAFCVV